MEKVKLTKKQAEALDYLLCLWESSNGNVSEYVFKKLVKEKLDIGHEWKSDNFSEANTIPDKLFTRALLDGYEVEQTPEEKLREYYELSNFLRYDKEDLVPTVRQRMIGEQMGVRKTLNILGIKVEGINAEFNTDKTEGDE